MHKSRSEAVATIEELRRNVDNYGRVEVVVCPPFTALPAVSEALKWSTIRLGAQNVHWEDQGAYTGEISVSMLTGCGCQYVILGHSERRLYFHETDGYVNLKLKRVLTTPLIPILCVGETLQQRESDRVEDIVLGQLEQGVSGLTAEALSRIIIAYEPVWAIGTGMTATPEVAEEVHAMIRDWLADVYSQELSEQIRILYGGSVKADNIQELMAQLNIDGALVGGASLDAETFSRIIKYES